MAAKVFDGLFLGDSATSMDADFLDLNKISRLINVAGRHLRNSLSGHGFVYKTYYWEDESDFLVFPAMERDKALLDMVEFVDASLRKGLSVLIFSDRGISRNAFAVCAFLMFKYHWGFEKSYDFIISKKRDIQINQGFVQQLFSLEKRLVTSRRKQLHLSDMPPDCDLVLRERLRRDEWDPNYLNCKSSPSSPYTNSRTKVSEDKLRGLRSDELSDDEAEDELLLVNSYLNGMNTITVLPGPYRNAYEMQKTFKLRFNGLLLEEDVHVFPTNPPSRYNPPPTPKGILRRKKGPPPASTSTPPLPPAGEQAVCPNKASSSDSSGDEADAKSASNRSSYGRLSSPISRPDGTAAVSSSGSGSGPGSGPGSPQKSWHNATSSDNSQHYNTSAHREDYSEAKKDRDRERENGVLESTLLNGERERGRGRGEQHSPPDSPPRLSLSVSDSDNVRYRDTDASNSYSNMVRALDGRNTQTAEDCMQNIMTDLRASSTAEDEKTNRNGRSSSSSGSSSSSSNSSSWNYSASSGYSALRDTDYSDTTSDRQSYRGGHADSKDMEREKERDPYEDLGSLSLHDLAALPLHFEKSAADRIDGRLNSSAVGKHLPSDPSRQGHGDRYKTGHGIEACDDYSSTRQPLSSKSNSRECSSSSSGSGNSSGHRTSSVSREITRSGSDEVERTDNPLASFQRLGQEGAVRVQYSSLLLPPSASYPTKSPQNAWQGSVYKEREKEREREKTLPFSSSVRSAELKTSINSGIGTGAGTVNERRAEREKEKEKEMEKKPLRTYRHGSPAPFKVSPRVLPAPQYPSSSSLVTQRARASSPSLVRRDRDRGSSPGPGPGSAPTSSSYSDRNRLYHSRSADASDGDRDRDSLIGGPELSAESAYSYSLRASTSNGRRNSAGGVGVTPLKPASPGTRRGKSSVSDFSTSSVGRSTARSGTPVRGNWR